ncbi:MFS drug efflux transporter [Ophiocordyceps sinensis CO18]|uniref:MFS drug efflux transporter n=1 Tax=Ophiocordyceps sinensis (strain Co18 / CGMCC 3.14243) TaxID=911162 RepID=T5AB85_OPHSC|nr:MFS drug efflux transporter [Ophiocordyceps sinensis CO18]
MTKPLTQQHEASAALTGSQEKHDFALDAVSSTSQGSRGETTKLKSFLLTMMLQLAVFLYGLNNAAIANIQPKRVVLTASRRYIVGGQAVIMPLVELYPACDAQRLFVFFTLTLLAALALCGAASDASAQIIGRAGAGAGVSGMLHGLLTLLVRNNNTSGGRLPIHPGKASVACALGFVLGPVIGGAVGLRSWFWAFGLNVLLGIVILVAGRFLIPSDQSKPEASLENKLASVCAAIMLNTGSIVSSAVATNCAGILFSWMGSSAVLVNSVSVVALVAFLLQQVYCIFTGLSDPSGGRFASVCYYVYAVSRVLKYLAVYYVLLYFQLAKGASAVETAKRTLPLLVPLVFAVLASKYHVADPRSYRAWMMFGSAVGITGSVLMSACFLTSRALVIWKAADSPGLMHVETLASAVYGFRAMLGLGTGFFAHSLFAAVKAWADSDNATLDVIWMVLGQMGGLGLALSAAGALFVHTANSRLTDALPDLGNLARFSLLAGTSGDVFDGLGERDRALVSVCIAAALRKVFVEAYAAAVLAFGLSSVVKSYKKFANDNDE